MKQHLIFFTRFSPDLSAALAGSASSYSLHMPGSLELQPIVLPQPDKDGGKSVLASLPRIFTCMLHLLVWLPGFIIATRRIRSGNST